MTIQLFECRPMHASIMPQQCEANRKKADYSSPCRTCKGLGVAVTIDQPTKPKETENMGRLPIKRISGLKKGDRFTCPDCGKVKSYESNGVCKACREKQKTWVRDVADESPVNEVAMEPAEDAALVDSLPADFGKVENAAEEKAAFGVDPLILANIRRTLAELEQYMVVDLSGVPFFEAMDYLQDIRKGMAREVAA